MRTENDECATLADFTLRLPVETVLTALAHLNATFPLTLLEDGAPSTEAHCLFGWSETQLRKILLCLANQGPALPVALQGPSSMHESSYRPVFTASHHHEQKLTTKEDIKNNSSSASQGFLADREHRHRRD